MKEIEVKILEVSHENLEPRILELGGEKILDETLDASFFDKDGEIVENEQHLRLRKQGEDVFLTHKTKVKNANVKEAEEIEIKVDNFATMKRLLEVLGYEVYASYSKRRVKYCIGEVILDFDKPLGRYSAVPEFMEIEAPSEELVFSTAKKLGITREQCLTWSGRKVLEHYGIPYP